VNNTAAVAHNPSTVGEKTPIITSGTLTVTFAQGANTGTRALSPAARLQE
jgi:hypothetical protein